MAVAAYTSLVSLKNILSNVYDRIEFQCPRLDRNQFDPLQERVDFLTNFLKEYSHRKSQRIQGLWRRISEVAFEAEYIIDTHVVNQLHKESQNDDRYLGDSTFCQDMDGLIQKIDFIKTELLTDLQEGEDSQARKQPTKVYVPAHASAATSSCGNDIVVGFDDYISKIMDELTSHECNLTIISITGMGGIGKSTLARNVYDNEYIALHFDVRSWTNISQEYVVEKILRDLLDDGKHKKLSDSSSLLDDGGNEEVTKSSGELGLKLHKKLIGRRYLIVLDDVWSINVWDELKMFFPNDMNRSRIIITTRLLDIASCLGSSEPHQMNFLNDDNSWKLLCLKTFLQEICPYSELEEIGKDIAKNCKGLPLTIVVVGSLLASFDMTQEYWEPIAKDIECFHNLEDYDHCLEILSLSYNNLPIHLKHCLLYGGGSHRDDNVVSSTISTWIAKGYIEPCESKSLRQIAKEYFMNLVNRNLISIHEFTSNWEMSRWAIHDIVRHLCWREYHKEHYMRSPKFQVISIKWEKAKACFFCDDPLEDKEKLNLPKLVLISPATSQISPSMCNECEMEYSHIKRLNLVKVMDNASDEYVCQELVHPTILHVLSITTFCDLNFVYPTNFHLLWSLQMLIIEMKDDSTAPIVLPLEIWSMPQLTHIQVTRAVLTYPTVKDIEGGKYRIILKNLHALSYIKNFMCTKEVAIRIPNLKDLQIRDSDLSPPNNFLFKFANLQGLERLAIDKPIFSLENISFPYSLKLLYLKNTEIPWKDMTIIGSLPNLEMLCLVNALIGLEWNPIEGEFLQLKALAIWSANLSRWSADETHFPKLETFVLRCSFQLEIPSGIGDIPTLSLIKLFDCSNYVINSVKEIWEEQRSIGNEMLRVEVVEKDGRCYQLGD